MGIWVVSIDKCVHYRLKLSNNYLKWLVYIVQSMKNFK
jgi:hypothetical protein